MKNAISIPLDVLVLGAPVPALQGGRPVVEGRRRAVGDRPAWRLHPCVNIQEAEGFTHTLAGRAARVALVCAPGDDVSGLARSLRILAPWLDVVVVPSSPVGLADRVYLGRIGVCCILGERPTLAEIDAAACGLARRYARVRRA